MKNSTCLFFIVFLFSSHIYAQVRIVSCEEPPTNYTSAGNFTGTTTDIVEEIKRYLNLEVKVEVKPCVRSFSIALNHPNVVIFTAAKTPQRIMHGFHFIGPVSTRVHAFWSLSDNALTISGIDDIKTADLVTGVMRGDWRAKFVEDMGIRREVLTEHDQGLKMLLSGRIDLWISSDLEAPIIAKKLGMEFNKIKMAHIIKRAESYILLSNDTSQHAIEEWETAYREIRKTDFFAKKAKKWSDILGIGLRYSNNKGFYVFP